jgi:hypothetical protein
MDIVGTEVKYVIIDDPAIRPPPSKLSLDPNSEDFHPCYVRVGVRVDGEERNDIAYYNTSNLSYKTNRDTSHLATTIEPYWRYPPSRQVRRAEEAWERKHRREV